MKKATEEIEQRIKEIEKKKLNKQKKLGSLGMGLKFSLDLISPIIVGILIGLGFDKFFLTKPIFFLFFFGIRNCCRIHEYYQINEKA